MILRVPIRMHIHYRACVGLSIISSCLLSICVSIVLFLLFLRAAFVRNKSTLGMLLHYLGILKNQIFGNIQQYRKMQRNCILVHQF